MSDSSILSLIEAIKIERLQDFIAQEEAAVSRLWMDKN
jgi:hypothetical protein